ncbi:hypothetical protein [Reyranella soli]|uniref:Methyltransferase domain-containing protein n=1 Tax=Reyranella soli TaxID=1230389 RepID=A0A512NI52_9HYPH|nr:hypothetical protein [Reyranella soli]GEP58620.1 hypothetical protein RSO01_57860 [Reyranella soli]
MPPLVTTTANLSFLDGYLYRVMVDLLKSEGASAGLYAFYQDRIENEGRALSLYDRAIFDYVLSNFDLGGRQIVHAGTGLGTLALALATAGYRVTGIEQDDQRFRTAIRVQRAVKDAWPAVAERYTLIAGEFPTVLDGTALLGPDTVLIFTNCGATWPDELTTRVIASFASCGDVILDTRLFGVVRNSPDERRRLVDRIAAQGLAAVPIATSPPDSFYQHVKKRLG